MRKKIPFVNLSGQYSAAQMEIDEAISRVLQSGWFILGQELDAFEKEFAVYMGGGKAVGVGSGTEALHLSLLACGISAGDEVITVPNTAVPTVSAISFAGARPVFIDIDPKTYTMDPNALEDYLKTKAQNSRSSSSLPKAIIPVHLYGHPAHMSPIRELAQAHEIKVIEDACQAHGVKYSGKMVGLLGDLSCYSFYPTKNLGAYGDGGMILSSQPELTDQVRRLRNYGEEKKNHNVIKGYNSRLDEIQAAILRAKLKHLDEWNQARRLLAETYSQGLASLPLILPHQAPYAEHIYHLYVIRTEKRDRLQAWLHEKGISTSVHYPRPIHMQPAYQDLGYQPGDFPQAEKCAAEILSLPLYPELAREDVEYIVKEIRKFFGKN